MLGQNGNTDVGAWGLTLAHGVLVRHDPIDSLVISLRRSLPTAPSDDATECVKRWLDQVVEVPCLVAPSRDRQPEVDLDGES